MKSFAQIKAIEKANKQRILKICPEANENSGIYVFARKEKGIKYGYVGQAKHLLTRLAQHLAGREQHIDKSLIKHKLWSPENPTGYRVYVYEYPIEQLDEMENKYIVSLANRGYQLRNKTGGSQHENKFGIADNRSAKTYTEGIRRGYDKCRTEVAKLFKKNLVAVINGGENKLKLKALEKWNDFLKGAGE